MNFSYRYSATFRPLFVLATLLALLAACSERKDEPGNPAAIQGEVQSGSQGVAGVASGQQLYTARCATCHGAQGEGNEAMHAPALAGQIDAYLALQLANFADGIRGSDPRDVHGASMAAQVAGIGAAEAESLAAFLAALPAPVYNAAMPAQETLARGRKTYQFRCASCHGFKGLGNAALRAPALAGLSAQYLERQYANYLSGVRGTHPRDNYGRQMRAIAATLDDEAEIKAVSAYISAMPALQ